MLNKESVIRFYSCSMNEAEDRKGIIYNRGTFTPYINGAFQTWKLLPWGCPMIGKEIRLIKWVYPIRKHSSYA